MTLIPHRTVVSQVAAQLRKGIAQGEWKERLPGERWLCEKMQVSRTALRQALEQLREERIIESRQGVGHRILLRSRRAKKVEPRSIGLLMSDPPEPSARLRPNVAFWMEELKERLHDFGCELSLRFGRSYYHAAPQQALRRLVRDEPHSGWIVALSTRPLQRWFMENKVPCVVAGSCYEDVLLPSVDLDYRSICRHAAGELLRQGHRRIVYFCRHSKAAGDAESERGFLEGAESSDHPGIKAEVLHHDGTIESVSSRLSALFSRKQAPTGLLVANSNWYLATVTSLARRNLRVPEDVSVISRNDDPFLDFVVPKPARYSNSPHIFTKKFLGLALEMLEGRPLSLQPTRIFPTFDPGASLRRLVPEK